MRPLRSRDTSKENATMYVYSLDELTWAVTRDREEEARRVPRLPEEKGAASESLGVRKPS
jgi:hypothetical protein